MPLVIEFTDWAVDILARADSAARRLNDAARVRLLRDETGVRFELTDEPEPTDHVIEHPRGFSLFVENGLEGVVDVVEPHDRLILRPPGDAERSVREAH
jgi:hypothetical protein